MGLPAPAGFQIDLRSGGTVGRARRTPLTADDASFLHVLGDQIRTARHRLGLSQRQLAEKSGVSRNFLSLVERGATGFEVLRLVYLADGLGIDPAELLAAVLASPHLAERRRARPHPVKAVPVRADQITRAGLP